MSTELVLQVIFFRTESGREPVREWLLGLEKVDRKVIGEDIKLVQFRWPLGLPLVRKMEPDLWEVRSHLKGGRVARVFHGQSRRNGAGAWLCQKGAENTVARSRTGSTTEKLVDKWVI